MEAFDSYYRPDTPSQRYRLWALTTPALLAGILPWVKPLARWATKKPAAHFAADLLATVLNTVGSKPPYPSAVWVVQVLLIVLAVSILLSGIKLQIQVLSGFAPASRMLRLAQKFLAVEVIMLVALIFTWPSH